MEEGIAPARGELRELKENRNVPIDLTKTHTKTNTKTNTKTKTKTLTCIGGGDSTS